MQVVEVEAPAATLVPAVLAHQPVQPALDAAAELEIHRIDGQHQRVLDDAGVEPVREDQFDAARSTIAVGAFLPLVEPGEAMQAPSGGLADRGRDAGRLQPVERGAEALVVGRRGTRTEGRRGGYS